MVLRKVLVSSFVPLAFGCSEGPAPVTPSVALAEGALAPKPFFPKADDVSLQALGGDAFRLAARLSPAAVDALAAVTGVRDRAVVETFPGHPVGLRDDGKGGDAKPGDGVFTANITLPATAVAERAALEESLAAQGLLTEVARFEGHQLVEYAERPAMSASELAAGNPVAVLPLPTTASLPTLDLATANALFITDALASTMVDNYDDCTQQGDPDGPWTFAHLMRQMAGSNDPTTFVRTWIDTLAAGYSGTSATNGFGLMQLNRVATLLANWPRRSDGEIDIDQAPFDLIAIVPRLDLRAQASSSYAGVATGGELRFIFAAGAGCAQEDFTVIFEYGKHVRDCEGMRDWARAWLDLAALDPANDPATYGATLRDLTLSVTETGAGPGRVNGSALNQLRTVVRDNALWRIREFRLDPQQGLLLPHTTVDTPDEYFRGAGGYTFFDTLVTMPSTSGVPLTLPDQNNQPVAFLGAEAITATAGTVWGSNSDHDYSNLALSNARHERSLGTCAGCHSGETGTLEGHIFHPLSRVMAPFLVGGNNLDPAVPHTVLDPVAPTFTPGSVTRSFFDLLRRYQDLVAVSQQLCADIAVDDLLADQIMQ